MKEWNKKPLVILISGTMGAGKTEFARAIFNELYELYGRGVIEVESFAKQLKKCAYDYMNWDGRKDEKGRRLLQHLGDVGREYDVNIWVKSMLYRLDSIRGGIPTNIIIVDDWRYPSEKEYFEKSANYDLLTVRVIRDVEGDKELLSHQSETSLTNSDKYDIIVYNTSDLYELNCSATRFIERYFGKKEK